MVDRWTEVVPGSDVWHSTRQLYDVVVLCIANRSVVDALVEVDASRSENTELFLRHHHVGGLGGRHGDGYDGNEVFRVVVAGCSTRAVATFGVIDSTHAVHLRISCSLVEQPAAARRPPLPLHTLISSTAHDDAVAQDAADAAHDYRAAGAPAAPLQSTSNAVVVSTEDIRSADVQRQSAAVAEWLQQSAQRRLRMVEH